MKIFHHFCNLLNLQTRSLDLQGPLHFVKEIISRDQSAMLVYLKPCQHFKLLEMFGCKENGAGTQPNAGFLDRTYAICAESLHNGLNHTMSQ